MVAKIKVPKQYSFRTKKEAEKYAVVEKHIVTDFEAALNNGIYKQMIYLFI